MDKQPSDNSTKVSQNGTSRSMQSQPMTNEEIYSMIEKTYPDFGGMYIGKDGNLNVYVIDPITAEKIGTIPIADLIDPTHDIKGIAFLKGKQT